MTTDLFPECHGGPSLSVAPLADWMAAALTGYPVSDAEALARIPRLHRREECFLYLRDFRRRGAEILSDMETIVRAAERRGITPIGGVSLAGVLRLQCERAHEIGNETACFYAFVLSLTQPDLAPYLASEGAAAEAMRKAGWKP